MICDHYELPGMAESRSQCVCVRLPGMAESGSQCVCVRLPGIAESGSRVTRVALVAREGEAVHQCGL